MLELPLTMREYSSRILNLIIGLFILYLQNGASYDYVNITRCCGAALYADAKTIRT